MHESVKKTYYPDGRLASLVYTKDAIGFHREDGPAFIEYEEEGSYALLKFRLHGVGTGFWEFYGRVSEDHQRTLLRDWLHCRCIVSL
jgi:hypothetical protein